MSNNKFNARHGLSVGSTPIDIVDDTGAILVNSASATKLATARTIAITGDVTYTSTSFDGTGNVTGAATLATVNTNVGSYGSSTQIPTITVNAKGLVTAVSTTAVLIPSGAISVTGGDLTLSGNTGTAITNATLVTVGAAGTYTKVTTDSKGRVTSGTALASADLPTYTGTLTSGQVTAGLGFTPENSTNKGAVNGYAGLDGTGKVPSTQLPSYVDDVLEYANTVAFPVSGETGKIYVTLDTNKTYRWSGSAYIEISASPGTTDAVIEGSTNLYFTTARARATVSASGSLSYNSTTGVISFTDAVTSVAGKTGAVTLVNTDVGLGNVENKSSVTIRSEITSGNVTTALGFTPYNATNPSGYITSSGNAATSNELLSKYPYNTNVISDGTTALTLSPGVGSTTVAMHNAHGYFGGYATTLTMSGYERYGAYQISGNYNATTPALAIRNYNQTSGTWNSWTAILSSANYTSYSPSLTGSGASGTWGISVNGTASYAANSSKLYSTDTSYAYGGSNPYYGYLTYVSANNRWRFQVTPATPAGVEVAYADNASTSTLLKSVNTTSTGASTWNPQGLTYQAWGQAFTHSSISADSGDLTMWLRASQYGSGGTELCLMIDGDYYAGTGANKVLHASNYSSYALPLSGGTLSGNLNFTNLYPSGNTSYGIQGNNGYFDTVNSGVDTDPLELVYVRGASVKIGSGTNGSKPLYAVGIYDNGNAVLHAGNITSTESSTGINPDSVVRNQIGYNTSVSLFGQTDGGLYSSAYSSSWIHQIYGDFRTGQIATRGKNSGTWQAWRTQLDSSNYNSYSPTLTGGGASGTWGISISGTAYLATAVQYLPNRTDGTAYPVVWGAAYTSGSGTIAYSCAAVTITSSSGTLTASNLVSGGSSVLTYSNAPRAANSSLMYYQGFTLDANTMSDNSTGFTYSVNAPWTGPIARFSTGGGYDLWLNGNYSGGGNTLSFRTRNGDSATLNPWRQILHDNNYANYAVPLSGGNMSGGLGRSAHAAGFQVGSYNSVGSNDGKSNPIYTIGSSYNPSDTAIGNMYGIGYSHANFFGSAGGTDWGLYVVAAGSYSALITGSGAWFKANVTAYSDETLKKNWRDLPTDFVDQLAKVKHGIYDRTDMELTQVGVSAQSLRPVLENAVTEDDTGKLSVAYGNAALVSAVELAKEVVDLRARVAQLEKLISTFIKD